LESINFHRSGRALIAGACMAAIVGASLAGGWINGEARTPRSAAEGALEEQSKSDRLDVMLMTGALGLPGLTHAVRDPGGVFFGKDGGTVIFRKTDIPRNALRALARGDADIILIPADALALHRADFASCNPSAFMCAGWSRGADAIASAKSLDGLSSIKGLRVTCARGSSGHFMMLHLLHMQGMNPEDMQWDFTVSPPDAAFLFARGRSDLCAGEYASVARAVAMRAGSSIVLSTMDSDSLIPWVFVTRESFLLHNRERLVSFARAWIAEGAAIADAPDPATELLGGLCRLSAGEAKESIARVRYAGVGDIRRACAAGDAGGLSVMEVLELASGLWEKQLRLRAPVPVSTMVNPGIAMQLAGHPEGAVLEAPAVRAYREKDGASSLLISAPLHMEFPPRSTRISGEARAKLRDLAGAARVYGRARILVCARGEGEDERWLNTAAARSAELARVLASEFGVPRDRVIEGRECALMNQYPDKNGRRADAALVVPRERDL
jgi:hypothetical protein